MATKIAISDCINCRIRPLSIFAGLSVDDLRELDMPVITMGYEAGETFYMEGSKPIAAFTVNTGVVKLVISLPNGRNQIVRLLTTGDIFGFEGLVDSEYHHTAVALTEARVCRLSLAELNTLSRRKPAIREALIQRWASTLRQAERMIVELGTMKASERLATFLERWCAHGDMEGWTPLPLTRQELGELLGLTVETVSRFLADWKRHGLIQEKDGKIRLTGRRPLPLGR